MYWTGRLEMGRRLTLSDVIVALGNLLSTSEIAREFSTNGVLLWFEYGLVEVFGQTVDVFWNGPWNL